MKSHTVVAQRRTSRQERGHRLTQMFENLESRLLLSVTYPDLQNWSQPSDNPTLQAGMDTFAPPVDSQTPGSSNPGLAELTRSGKADDALALTGYQLSSYTGADLGKDTQFTFWSQTTGGNGTSGTGSILRLEGAQAAVTIPSGMLSNSMYLVWAQNNSGPSYPLAINRTEAWWTGSNIANVGQSVSVFGRNLSYHDSTYASADQSWIYIKPSGGAGQWVTPTAVNPYKVTFTVPSLANGTYEVWIHNGHGGKYGWSRSGDLTVQSAITWTGTVRNVKSYGAVGNGVTDDTAAINAAIAASANGDKIYFPTGTYATGATARFNIPANRQVYGDGKTLSILNSSISMQGSSKINDMAVVCNTINNSPVFSGSQIWATNVNFSETVNDTANTKTLDISGANYVYLTGCKFTGNQVWIGAGTNFYFDTCDFYMRFDAENAISSWGSQALSVINCTAQHYDTSNPNSSSGWGEGRFITNTCDWGNAGYDYYGNNRTNDFVVRSGGDQNSGEQIMSESSKIYYYGGITACTSTTVTFNPGGTNPSGGMQIIVVGGKGIGQVREVASYNSGTQTTTVTQPWNVQLDATSQIQLLKEPTKIAIYNNYFDGTATAVNQTAHVANMGVDLFTGGTNEIVDKNTFHEMRYGVNWDAATSNGSYGARTLWNTVYNNTFDTVRWAIKTNGYGQNTGVTALGHTFRSNTVTNVAAGGAAFDDASGSGTDTIQLTVYDNNQVTNTAVGYNMEATVDTHNTIFYKNSFSRGTAALSGSVGLQFGVLNPDLAGKGTAGGGWTGAWAGASSDQYNQHTKYINGRQLSYSTTGYSNSGNNSTTSDGAAGQTATWTNMYGYSDRYFTTAMTGTIWVSALVNRYEATWTMLGFNADPLVSPGNTAKTSIGLNGSNQAWMQYNAVDLYLGQGAAVTAPLGTTHLMLVKITMNYSGTYDRVEYWFDPNLSGGQGGLGTPTLTNSGADAVGASLQGISILTDRSSGATDTNLLDSLRISNDANGFTAVTTGSGGTLVADYFNNYWGPIATEPSVRGNTFTNYETTYGGNAPKPGSEEIPTRVLAATVAAGSSTTTPLTLWNVGTDAMSWTGSSDSAWLTLSSSSGSLTDQNATATITLTCNAASLGVGTYTGTVTMTSGSQTEKARVVFTVTAAAATVTLSATDASASETGPDNGVFTVTRTGSTSSALVVNYTITGTATNTSDYTTLATSVSIPIGQTSATITVTPVDDSLIEGSETVILTLGSGSYTIGSPSTGTVTIADNDVPAITITATDANASETGPDTGTFTVTRTGSGPALTTGALTVNFTISGTATNTSDYSTLTTSVVIANGQTSATITVTPVDDSTVESSETVILTLASGTGYTIGAPSNATVTIADNDSGSGGLVDWLQMDDGTGTTATDASGTGNNASLVNGVVWSTDTKTGAGDSLSFDGVNDYATINSAASLNIGNNITVSMWIKAAAQSAFPRFLDNIVSSGYGLQVQAYQGTAQMGVIVNTSGGSNQITMIDNVMNNTWNHIAFTLASGTIKVYLNGALVTTGSYNHGGGFGNSNAWSLGALTNHTGNFTGKLDNFRVYNRVLSDTEVTTVYNSETSSAATVTLSATDAAASETGPDNGVFTVTRTGSTTNALVVNYTITGTATNTSDYSTLATSVSIPAGQTSATITVTPVDDSAVEGNETVILTLAFGGYTIGSPSTGTVTIADNDATGLVDWIQMNDGSGTTATDASGSGNNATLVNGTAWSTDTKTGTGDSLSFDGVNDYASISSAANLNISNNLTVSMWVKAAAQTGFPRFFDTIVSGGYGVQIQAFQGTAQMGVIINTSGGTNQMTMIDNVMNSTWNHIAFTLSSGTIKVYLNGTLITTGSYNQGSGFGNTNAWSLGALTDHTGNFTGKLDNFRAYNRVLNDTEVTAIYNAERV